MKKLSLVLVTVDCLRADHVGFLGYSRPTTPFLDTLARESIVFPCALVAGAPTYFSFPGIMAARHPLALGRDIVGISPGEPTLASTLQAQGWTTAGFVAGNPYLTARFGYDQGFDSYHDYLSPSGGDGKQLETENNWATRVNVQLEKVSRKSKLTAAAYQELYFRYCQCLASRRTATMESLRPYPAADVLLDQTLSWLRGTGDKPFFIWLHLMDPHHPYYPPEESLELFGSRMTPRRARFLNSSWNRDVGERRLRGHRESILSLYDAGIRWADTQLSRLVDTLRQSGRWKDTAFAVTADHGEEFLEHGRRYHSPVALPDTLIRVPLLLHVPGVRASKLPDLPFSLVDLAPSLMDALGAVPPSTLQGSSCWPQILNNRLPDRPAVTECLDGSLNPGNGDDCLRHRILAVRQGPYKLVVRFADSSCALYNLESDPRELSPIPAGEKVEERRRLLLHAQEHLRKSRAYSGSEFRMRERLRQFRHSLATSAVAVGVGQS